ncbi:hypothetical protein [Rhizobium paknamense]|uniref:Threonine/homoserine/homoserine lactone efflux protein n=1 Tax=Rhizobium paknamense TaxID=1206817 RepID=A0ABU0IB19_9HYPH|nr:hypothetical protein [Rhizobium paknamense]MDQ0455416.1 threonine/homoserine/homoserine lactone efflux protein [Rhizobium paknamense]
MPLSTFLFAVLALLLAPGPTNTLMGVAGARFGLTRVLRLLPAEISGYLTTIIPLLLIGQHLPQHWPGFAATLKLAAAVWVLILALKLWHMPVTGEDHGHISAGRVYVTTMLNPKALVFALVLLPAPGEAVFPLYFGLFIVLVGAVAVIWGVAGRLTQTGQGGPRRLQTIQRLAALWLGFLSFSLMVGVMTA